MFGFFRLLRLILFAVVALAVAWWIVNRAEARTVSMNLLPRPAQCFRLELSEMIIDHRTYYTKPVKTGDFLELWERMALPYQMKYLEGFVGMFTCDVGDLSQVVHMWSYADQGDRERRRTAMYEDPGWLEYVKALKESELIVKMETKILKPVPFSPLR
jgi:hypothetical protein